MCMKIWKLFVEGLWHLYISVYSIDCTYVQWLYAVSIVCSIGSGHFQCHRYNQYSHRLASLLVMICWL